MKAPTIKKKKLRIGCKQTALDPALVFSSRPKVQPVSKRSPKPSCLNLCKHRSCKRVVRYRCSQTSTPCSWLIKHISQNKRMRVKLWYSFTQIIRFSNEVGDRKNSRGAPMAHSGFLSTPSSASNAAEGRSSHWQVRSDRKSQRFGSEGALGTAGQKVWETASDKMINNKSWLQPTLAIWHLYHKQTEGKDTPKMVSGAPWIISNCPLRQVAIWGDRSSEEHPGRAQTQHGLLYHQPQSQLTPGFAVLFHGAVFQRKGRRKSGQKAVLILSQENCPWPFLGTGVLTETLANRCRRSQTAR